MGARVLLVDDSPVFRESMADLLGDLGYVVTGADDGIEALAAMELWEFALVITNLQMPRLDGLELIKALRSSERFSKLPTVAMSALGSQEEKTKAMVAGATVFLDKTASDQEVAQTLKRLLGEQGPKP